MGDLEPDDFFVAAGGQSAGDPYGYLRRRPGARGRGGPPAALGAAGSGAARSDASGRAGVASCGGGGGVGVGAGSGAGALVLGAAGRAGRLGGRAGTVALDAGRRVLSGTGQWPARFNQQSSGKEKGDHSTDAAARRRSWHQ